MANEETKTGETVVPLVQPGTVMAITCDDWFFAADGQQYRVAFGPVTIIKAVDVLGFTPKGDTNWYAQVGTGNQSVVLAGCRIHSALLCASRPAGSYVYDASA